MKIAALLSFVACAILIQGCSKDSVKRTSYETVQNLGERQCLEDLSTECPPRERYDDYQRRRSD